MFGMNVLLAESANVSAVPEDEQGHEHDRDADGRRDDREDQDGQGDRAAQVDRETMRRGRTVGGGAPHDAEDQRRQIPGEDGQRDEERITRLGRDEERARGEHDPVAHVVHERSGQEPAEAAAEPRRDDGLGRPGQDGLHRRQDTLPGMSAESASIAKRIADHFAWIGKDEVRAAEIYAEDAILEYVQSGERIRGKANIVASRRAYPGRPAAFDVRRSGGS